MQAGQARPFRHSCDAEDRERDGSCHRTCPTEAARVTRLRRARVTRDTREDLHGRPHTGVSRWAPGRSRPKQNVYLRRGKKRRVLTVTSHSLRAPGAEGESRPLLVPVRAVRGESERSGEGAEEPWETLQKLVRRKVTCRSRYAAWLEPPRSGMGRLKALCPQGGQVGAAFPGFVKDRKQSCLGAVLRAPSRNAL